MDKILAILGLLMGYFAISIGVFIVEYVINKSINEKWGFKVTKTVLVLNLGLLVFGFLSNKN